MPRRYLDQRLKLPLLRVADALDAHGSLLKAASALGVGQPALIAQPAGARGDHRRALVRAACPRRATDRGGGRRHPPRAPRPGGAAPHRRGAGRGRRHRGRRLALGVLPVASVGVLPGALIRLKAAHPASGPPAAGAHGGVAAVARLARARSGRGPPLRARGARRLLRARRCGRSRSPSSPASTIRVFAGAGSGHGRGARAVRHGAAHRQPAGRAGDRAPALPARPRARRAAALLLLRLHPGDAAGDRRTSPSCRG